MNPEQDQPPVSLEQPQQPLPPQPAAPDVPSTNPVPPQVNPNQPTQPEPIQPTVPQAAPTNPYMMGNPASNPTSPQTTAPAKYPDKTLAIVSLVLALFLPPIGLIIAIIAYMKSKKAGTTNTLAIISVVVNIMLLVVSVLLLLLFLNALNQRASDMANDTVTPEKLTQEQEEFAANVIVGKPLADLRWDDLYTSSDSSWEIINEEEGTGQFQHVTSKCAVTFDQPAGLIAEGVTSSEQVAEDFAELVSSESAQYTTKEDNRLVINFSQPDGLIIPFETYAIKDTNNKPVGLVSSFVQDDFGLIVSGVCPPNSTSELQTSVRSFMQSKTATLIYQ